MNYTKQDLKDLVYKVNGAAIEVHKHLEPGLLESVYHKCLIRELELKEIKFKSELSIPIEYKGIEVNAELRCDLIIENILVVELKSVTHWKSRQNEISCADCPVLHLCQGSCMYLDGKHWDVTCDNAYSDNIALFALAFEKMTGGYIPVTIKGDGLPLSRQDIWGTVYKHEEKKKRPIIPIKIVSEKTGVINDVEIYGKSRLEV